MEMKKYKLGVPAALRRSGFSGFRCRFIPTLSLRNGYAAPTIPNAFLIEN